jgi:hypothetical protein
MEIRKTSLEVSTTDLVQMVRMTTTTKTTVWTIALHHRNQSPQLSCHLSASATFKAVESDIEELAPAKKNRRGQRARQQIAEKKFGAKAKHLENPKNDRNQGWDAKKGATDGARGGRGGRGGFGAGRGGFGAGAGRGGGFNKSGPAPGRFTGGDAPAPPKIKHNDDEGPLHPSWAAAKAAKEKKAVPIVFAGKKTSFD